MSPDKVRRSGHTAFAVGRGLLFVTCTVVAVASAWAVTWYLALVIDWDEPYLNTTWFEWRRGLFALVLLVLSCCGMCLVRHPRRSSPGKWCMTTTNFNLFPI
jgi:hypothetical protein